VPERTHRHGEAAAHDCGDRGVVGVERGGGAWSGGGDAGQWWRLLRRGLLRLMRVLHIALAGDWAAAQAAGSYQVSSRGRTLAAEGFIHTSTSRQVEGVLGNYYADVDPAQLRLLVIDVPQVEQAGSPVRWDEVTGAPAPFPHVYGPIVPDAVVAVLPIGGATGAAVLPDVTAWDVAAGAPN
jgi:uncharacterized protein (DUF952 family)